MKTVAHWYAGLWRDIEIPDDARAIVRFNGAEAPNGFPIDALDKLRLVEKGVLTELDVKEMCS